MGAIERDERGERGFLLDQSGPGIFGKQGPGWNEHAEPSGELTQSVAPKHDTERGLLCCVCRTWITSWRERIFVEGCCEYEFSNPHGIVFRIGCFAAAQGCCGEGEPEEYWSWFANYSWQIQRCAGCFHHLGWLYSKPGHHFYGLSLSALCEGDRL